MTPNITGFVKPINLNGNGNPKNSFAFFFLIAKNGHKFKIIDENNKIKYTKIIRICKFVSPESNNKQKAKKILSAKEYYFENFDQIYKNYINKEKKYFKTNETETFNIKIDEDTQMSNKFIKVKVADDKKKTNSFINLITIKKKIWSKDKKYFIESKYSFYLNKKYLEVIGNKDNMHLGYEGLIEKPSQEIKDQLIEIEKRMKRINGYNNSTI